jgi:hypothetical protein
MFGILSFFVKKDALTVAYGIENAMFFSLSVVIDSADIITSIWEFNKLGIKLSHGSITILASFY